MKIHTINFKKQNVMKFVQLMLGKNRLRTIGPAVLTAILLSGFASAVLAHEPEDADYDRFILFSLMEAEHLTAEIILTGLVFATLLGALHALSPGHGKSIVAAYLVGTRGTIKHAIFLGATVTVTHTFGVFLLGIVALFASDYILPKQLYPYLSMFSGTIVCIIGLVMLKKRIVPFFQPKNDHQQYHSDDHGHHHHFFRNSGKSHVHNDHVFINGSKENIPISDSHQDNRQLNHSHNHTERNLRESWSVNNSSYSWRSLLALGISAGILPCPSAFVVLLGAISINRIGFGLLLIIAFSLGLAGTLTAVGLLFVKARHFLDRISSSGLVLRILPLASAFLIVVLGAGIIINSLFQIP